MKLRTALRLLAIASIWIMVAGRCAWSTLIYQPESSYPHTLDGYFTGWSPGATSYEWDDITPIKGVYSYLYLDYTTTNGGTLWVMNDWIGNPQTITSSQYNYFNITYGTNDFQVWIYTDPSKDIFELNGQPVTTEIPGSTVQGAYGFGASPNSSTPHTMYEFEITDFPALPAGALYTGSECDPVLTNGCVPDDSWGLEPDPTDGGTDSGALPEPSSTLLIALGLASIALWQSWSRR